MARRTWPIRLFNLIVTLPVTLLVVLFSISNRHMVDLSLWPLPSSVTAPLFLVALFAMLAGFLVGGFVVWNGGRVFRRRAREAERREAVLEKELARTESDLEKARMARAANPDQKAISDQRAAS